MSEHEPTTGAAEQGSCAGGANCLCAGAGPTVSTVVSQVLRELGPSEPVRKHFNQARLEILKGLRALLDDRINDIQKQPSRGVKLTVD